MKSFPKKRRRSLSKYFEARRGGRERVSSLLGNPYPVAEKDDFDKSTKWGERECRSREGRGGEKECLAMMDGRRGRNRNRGNWSPCALLFSTHTLPHVDFY